MRFESFEEIDAWKRAREVTQLIYQVSSGERFSRDFALVNQIRRAAISIVSNIAEGFERNGDREFIQFLTVAKGSCGEVRAQVYIAFDQGYLDENQFANLKQKLLECSRMIAGLIRYLKSSELKGSKFN